jgi:hypothetical protein
VFVSIRSIYGLHALPFQSLVALSRNFLGRFRGAFCVRFEGFCTGGGGRDDGGEGVCLRIRHVLDEVLCVTLVLPWCYRGVTVVLQLCHSGVTMVLQWRSRNIYMTLAFTI